MSYNIGLLHGRVGALKSCPPRSKFNYALILEQRRKLINPKLQTSLMNATVGSSCCVPASLPWLSVEYISIRLF
ncbi:hypothetical protein J6590_098262 [Homalodisca vitripennis]|nr:hypothetical protein J6590_098262 [Homalodisca vitripennis]